MPKRFPATSPATDVITPNDPRLTDLIEEWDALPEALRAGIAAMVAAAHASCGLSAQTR